MIVKNKMDHDDIKQAIICAPNEFRRALKEIILNCNTFSNCHISLYRKGICIEENDSIFYNYSNISRIYCISENGLRSLCIDYLNQRIELTSCSYSGNGTNEETNKNRMLDSLVILLTIYWKAYNTK